MTEDFDEERAREWYDRKTGMMVAALGPEHDVVMHAVISYAAGGGLDLYYFPRGIPGTAIATKELCESPDDGPSNEVFRRYELVMFTRHRLSLDDARDERTPFGAAHQGIDAVLHCIAPYSAQAKLNPNDTCEFPASMGSVGGKCLIFDAYGPQSGAAEFGVLAVIEIHRSEMDHARENGGEKLIGMLKAAGYYPYSDLDRPSVVGGCST